MSDTTDKPDIIVREGTPEPTFEEMRRAVFDEPAPQHEEPKIEATEAPARHIPVAALEEERKKRQKYEAEAEELRKMVDLGNQRLQELIGNLATQERRPPDATAAPQPSEIPDSTIDPVGHFKAITAKQQKALEELREKIDGAGKRTQAQELQAQFMARYSADAQDFASKEKNFAPAYNHLMKELVSDLTEAGFSQQDAARQVQSLEAEMAVKAWQAKENVSERLYKMALRRGFKAEETSKQEDFDTVRRGVERASSSLARATGATNQHAGLTAAQIGKMSPAEWSALPYNIRQWALRGFVGSP